MVRSNPLAVERGTVVALLAFHIVVPVEWTVAFVVDRRLDAVDDDAVRDRREHEKDGQAAGDEPLLEFDILGYHQVADTYRRDSSIS